MTHVQPTAASVPRQTARVTDPHPTGWVGWILFGGTMLVLVGSFQAIEGLVALFNKTYYVVGPQGLLVTSNLTAWGWTHLLLGVVAAAAGFGMMAGRMWARIVGVVFALASALVNLAFVGAYPVWAMTIIALDVLVIYALTAHGAELENA